MIRHPWVTAISAACVAVSLCVCRSEAADRKPDTPVRPHLKSAVELDAAASEIALRLDGDARQLNAGRVPDPAPDKVTVADIHPRRAFLVSAFNLEDTLLPVEKRLDEAFVRAYEGAMTSTAPSASSDLLETALQHYAVLVRRQSGQSWHTVVPGLVDDPACAGDIIGDQLLSKYFSTLFSSAEDARERAIFQLTELARHAACLGTAQAAQIARELTGAYAELEAFLRSIGRGDLLPYVANVVAQPLLLFYDIDIYRARQSDLYHWFNSHKAELIEGSTVKRMPVIWHSLWLYDRRTGRLVGFTDAPRPKNPREVNLAGFLNSITRLEQLGGGACSFSEMIQRGGDATSGYFCAGQSCAGETMRNQGDLQTALDRHTMESLAKTFDGNFSPNLACTLTRDGPPGAGSAACPETGGAGLGPDAAMLSCVTRQIARPGLEEMSCLAEATGFCSSPVDRITKDLQMQQYSGVRIGRDCGVSQGTIEGHLPVVNPKHSQALKEARQQLKDIKNALGQLEDPLDKLADAGVWDRLIEKGIQDRERAIEQMEQALEALNNQIRDTLQQMKDAADAGDQKKKDELSKLADDRIEEEHRLRLELEKAQRSLERLKRDQEKNSKQGDPDAGTPQQEDGGKRCVQGAETCGGNSCTAMASAVGQALQCVITRRQAAEAPEIHDPRGCTPELCDPIEPEGEGGRADQCLAELESNPTATGAKQCWAVRCPSGQVPTVGPGGNCVCGAGEFAGATATTPVAEMCQYMRCTGGDNAQVASMQSGGSCGCAPDSGGGGGTIQSRDVARLMPALRSLLDLNPNVQEAVNPLLPEEESERPGQPDLP